MKINWNILLVMGILISNIGFSQNFERTKADSLREEGKLKEAIAEYAKQYRENPDDRTSTYNYACALALDWQIDSAFHYLNIAVANDTSVQALNDPDFYFLLGHEKWKELENTLVERVEAKYGKYENAELSKELWRMKIKDQAFYYHLQVAEKAMGINSPVILALWELKSKLNEENVAGLEEIIEEHGWPKTSVVKGSAASAVFLIIQHADIEVQKKYLPMMKEAANTGEASWSSLALLIDRVNLREGKKQIYGSQIYRDEGGSYYVKDLKEPEYVNQRRKEVGLGPIEDYVNGWGIEWTIGQKIKPVEIWTLDCDKENPDLCGYKDQNGEMKIARGKYAMCFTETFKHYAIVFKPGTGLVGINKNEKVLYEVFLYDNGPDYPSEGYFRIVKNEKMGFADVETGEVKIQPLYNAVKPFENGYAAICPDCETEIVGEYSRWVNGKWGLIDKSGKVVVESQYDGIEKIRQNGRVMVKMGKKEKWVKVK